ncbi:hypothetical protein [Allomuricauda sp. d1]|uniref:hypothetical protein n=1 Tax=Allomuricauda sp. d1 TaxID=3136725 RepID=UPI0031E2F818
MRKIATVLVLAFVASCSDGDLEIEAIDFDSVAVENCGTVAEDTQIFFKRNGTEALILTLQNGLLDDGTVGDTTITSQTSSIPSQSQLVYRIFNDDVPSNYFCDAFPPVSPTVIEEVEAEDGILTIETKSTADGTAFEHTLTLSEISLVNDQGERITDLSINEFGEITIAIPQN